MEIADEAPNQPRNDTCKRASPAVQMAALMKKNLKVHMRTNAVPCVRCGDCVPFNACCLHVMCPAVFVALVTALPFIIVSATSESEAAREEFLNVNVDASKLYKVWTGWSTAYSIEPAATWGYDESGPGYGIRPVFDPIFKADAYYVPRNRGDADNLDCEYQLPTCHCQTLAIVGPDDVVAAFKTHLQDQYTNWTIANATSASASIASYSALSNDVWPRIPGGGRLLSSEVQATTNKGVETLFHNLSSLLDVKTHVTEGSRFFVESLKQLKERKHHKGSTSRRLQDEEEEICSTYPIPQQAYCNVASGHDAPIWRQFSSESAVDEWIDSKNYGRYDSDRSETSSMDRLCGAVVFHNDPLSSEVPQYTIRLNSTLNIENRIPSVNGFLTNYEIMESEVGHDAFDWYYGSGFHAWQHMVHKFIADKRSPDFDIANTADYDFIGNDPQFVLMQSLQARSWAFGDIVGGILGNPFILVIMFGPIVSSIAFYIVRERATRQRELLRMMGLGDGPLLWSWVVLFAILNLLIALFTSIFFVAFFFKNVNFFILWMGTWWFANACLTFGMFISAFVSSDRTSAMIAFGMFFVTVFMNAAIDEYDSTSKKMGLSVLPPVGFNLLMTMFWNWELRGITIDFSNAGYKINNMSVDISIWMLFLDFWIYLILYFYFDSIVPWHSVGVPRKPWFLFQSAYWREVMGKPPLILAVENSTAENSTPSLSRSDSYIEPVTEAHLKILEEQSRVVQIRNLKKTFKNASGQPVYAVGGVTITMYEDECFCLLGHNGAGKTTTMMMLTGCLPQSAGTIHVKGFKIPEQVREIRSSMGFCPQHNVLIDELTVYEHLELFGRIGGMTISEVEERGDSLLSAVALLDKKHTRSNNLSGGMKRKLSCALAFLAKPYLVILDEPSSGMDPFARRGMWDTLKCWRMGHILCLTTHYMDEADALGDRIAIMVEGQVACSGSSRFLKAKFGCGYVLSFAKVSEKANQDEDILKVVMGQVGHAAIMSSVGRELLIQMPFEAADFFPSLFPVIDDNLTQLGIESYGTNITNLEEVFIKVAKTHDEERTAIKKESTAELIDHGISIKQASFGLQLYALLARRLKFGYRNPLTCVGQIGIPTFCIVVFFLIVQLTASFALPKLELTTDNWNSEVSNGPQVPTTVGTVNTSSVAFRAEVETMWNLAEGVDQKTFTTSSAAAYPYNNGTDPQNVALGLAEESGFVLAMKDEPEREASRFGAVLYPTTSSWCPASYDSCLPQPGVTVVANETALHASAVMFNVHAGAALARRTDGSVKKLSVSNHPFQSTYQQESSAEFVSGIFAAIIIMASYGFIPSGVTSYVVMEKEKDVKNQLIISGCNYAAYWTSNYIFDSLWGMIPAIGAWVTFAIYDVDAFVESPGIEASVALFIMYMPAMAGLAYLFSFLFSRAGTALFVSWIFNMLVGIVATILISVFITFDVTYEVGKVFLWIFRFIPIFSLGYGHLMISVQQDEAASRNVGALSGIGVGGTYCLSEDEVIGKYRDEWYCTYMVGDEFLVLWISSFLFIFLVIFIDVVVGLPWFKGLTGQIGQTNIGSDKEGDSLEDSMVKDEKERVRNLNAKEQFVYVNNVYKRYRNGKLAVRGISFAAAEGQVFGLLGVNGAGKTTTFKMLCGQESPSAGEIVIQGYNVTLAISDVRKHIGYCPQFDALLDSLTAEEHLRLYGRLKGLSSTQLHSAVKMNIRDMDLLAYVQTRAGQMSGGNKRKLSVAMATIGEPPMVFLDEPSAGMDPMARRGMWTVIQDIAERRKKSVVILTTHSMEEAEALCSRIAIQVDGKFRCLGSSQQIKARYGQGLELNVRFATPTPQEIIECCEKLGVTKTERLNSTKAAELVEKFYGQGVLLDLRGRQGSPIATSSSVAMNDLAEWVLFCVRTQEFELFLVSELSPNAQETGQYPAVCLEKSQNVMRYQIMPVVLQGQFRSLGGLFNLFQENKDKLNLQNFHLCQPSLEQIFNKFATTQMSQAGATTAREAQVDEVVATTVTVAPAVETDVSNAALLAENEARKIV